MTETFTNFRKGDSSKAFGNHFLRISVKGSEGELSAITKAEFITGCIKKVYVPPEFPLIVDFSVDETEKLNYVNVGYLRVYDEFNEPLTCTGSIKFYCKNGVICQC